MNIKPIEDFVFEGLINRIQQVFGCVATFTTANDKTKVLARLREGSGVQYPYIFLTIPTISHNKESYATNLLARRGVINVVSEDVGYTTRILPTNFDIEVEFITNKFQSVEQGSVTSFTKRWLFAQRCGYLKFNIMYGRLQLPVSITMSDSVTIPPLDNKVETESAYKLSTTLTTHGYSSESELGTQGIVNTLIVDEVLANSDGAVPGYQFLPF